MATYQYYAYSSTALTYNATTHTFTLRADFDPARDRIIVTINDDDRTFNGDSQADELGSDANQTATVTQMDGTVIATGRVYDEEYSALRDPNGQIVEIDRIEIGGNNLGYFSTSPLVPGFHYSLVGTYNVSETDNSALTYDQIQSAPCFARGTYIATKRGEVRIEHLEVGDRVVTLDSGYQPVLWIGQFSLRDLPQDDMPGQVEFAVGSLGRDLPNRPLTVTATHRMLIAGADVALHFGEHEALAAAGHLGSGRGSGGTGAQRFYHLLLPRHELILANGVWTESLFAAGRVVDGLPLPIRSRVRALAGTGHEVPARLCLKRWEVQLLGRSGPARARLAA
ncbi:MAG: Hint domain-containing protein [Rhodobacteraceae bacterium]|nr:Hint domain-containing protein [Paracoccaceae bacterium]